MKFGAWSNGSPGARALAASLCALLVAGPSQAAQDAGGDLKIEALEGGGAVNNIKAQRAKDVVVRVMNEAGTPVSGATVTFILPNNGASGAFLDGGTSLTVMTGEGGRAATRGLHPNRSPGQFLIRVNASYRGQTGSLQLTQTNAEPAEGSGNGKLILILALVGGGAAGGLAAAMGGKGKSSAPSTPPPTPGPVITPGNPTFGPPQ